MPSWFSGWQFCYLEWFSGVTFPFSKRYIRPFWNFLHSSKLWWIGNSSLPPPHSYLSTCVTILDKIPDKIKGEEKETYFGSQFQKNPRSPGSGASGHKVRQNVTRGECGGANLLSWWWPGGREREWKGLGTRHPLPGYTTMTCFLQLGPKSYSFHHLPVQLWTIRGLIHCWDQNTYDPFTLQRPHLAALGTTPSTHEPLANISYPKHNTALPPRLLNVRLFGRSVRQLLKICTRVD